jgi:hypothetical protein
MDRTLAVSGGDDAVSGDRTPDAAGNAMLEAGALAYRRLENGEIEVLLVSKKRSKKMGHPQK